MSEETTTNEANVDFIDSLSQAEEACFQFLCEKLGLTPARDAFISVRDGAALDCVVFDVGHLQEGELMCFNTTNLYFRGQMDIYNRSRREVQHMIMRLIQAFPVGINFRESDPLRGESNVLEFRIAPVTNAIGDIVTKELETTTSAKEIPVFVCSIQFDIVFQTGARQN